MSQRFEPTVQNDPQIGGSINFGTKSFVPNISGLTGATQVFGKYQSIGSIIIFGVYIQGESTASGAIFTPPVLPYTTAGLAIYTGILFDEEVPVVQALNGTFALPDGTKTNRRLSGYYWVN